MQESSKQAETFQSGSNHNNASSNSQLDVGSNQYMGSGASQGGVTDSHINVGDSPDRNLANTSIFMTSMPAGETGY